MSEHSRGGERSPQPEDAFERFAAVYDQLGFDRFTPTAIRKCTEFLAESQLAVTSLLDLACGTGHFAIDMAGKGINVTGVDGSAQMIKQAHKNAGRMKNKPQWIQGEFMSFDAGSRFDLVTCWFDSLNHLLTDAQLTRCFRRVYRHLEKGGAFLFDVNTAIGLKERWSTANYRSDMDSTLMLKTFAEPAGEFAWLELEAFVKRGKHYERIKIPFYQRGLSADTLQTCLTAARFRDIDIVAFDGPDPVEDASRLLVSAWR